MQFFVSALPNMPGYQWIDGRLRGRWFCSQTVGLPAPNLNAEDCKTELFESKWTILTICKWTEMGLRSVDEALNVSGRWVCPARVVIDSEDAVSEGRPM